MSTDPFARRDAGGALLRSFISASNGVSRGLAESLTATRALDELAQHLEARGAADAVTLRRLTAPSHKRAPPGGHPPRTGGPVGAALAARLVATSECSVDAAEAKLHALDAAVVQVDAAIRDLDLRARLLETLLREQGAAAGNAAAAAAGRRSAPTAPAGGGRTRRSTLGGAGAAVLPIGSGDGGGEDGEAAPSARRAANAVRAQVERRVAAAASQSASEALELEPAGLIHEPTYCSCRQVAFGTMVECDDTDCPIGWYHAACVGVGRDLPAGGTWLCPECSRRRREAVRGEGAARPSVASTSAAAEASGCSLPGAATPTAAATSGRKRKR